MLRIPEITIRSQILDQIESLGMTLGIGRDELIAIAINKYLNDLKQNLGVDLGIISTEPIEIEKKQNLPNLGELEAELERLKNDTFEINIHSQVITVHEYPKNISPVQSCPLCKNGVPLKKLIDHLKGCRKDSYSNIRCKCGKKFSLSGFSRHLHKCNANGINLKKTDPSKLSRFVSCPKCERNIGRKGIETHLVTCAGRNTPVKCRCGESFSSRGFRMHLRQCDANDTDFYNNLKKTPLKSEEILEKQEPDKSEIVKIPKAIMESLREFRKYESVRPEGKMAESIL